MRGAEQGVPRLSRSVARAGVTLPELILVAWLFALVLGAVAEFAAAQGRLVALTHDRVRMTEAVRVARVVLGSELRALGEPDISVLATDSLRIRAVRGAGAVCGLAGSELLVHYRGVRRPEPAKDSVLLIRSSATAGTPFALLDVAADSRCGGALRLTLGSAPPGPAVGVALVFETGSYSMGNGALRYRRGAGGRQPLTETILSDGWLRVGAPTELTVGLDFDARALPRLKSHLEATLRLRIPGGSAP